MYFAALDFKLGVFQGNDSPKVLVYAFDFENSHII